jgi:hypothetical protein
MRYSGDFSARRRGYFHRALNWIEFLEALGWGEATFPAAYE